MVMVTGERSILTRVVLQEYRALGAEEDASFKRALTEMRRDTKPEEDEDRYTVFDDRCSNLNTTQS